jgi:hypothetical protein
MTGDRRWFSSLTPVMTKEYITFGDNEKGRVLLMGTVKVSEYVNLRRVSLVKSLGYNLLSVSHLFDDIFEVRFKMLLGCWCFGGALETAWRLGHLSFDLLSRLSGLGLVRGLTELKYQKDLVCAPCRHGKMVAVSHPPLTSVMTERPCELFHMDLVGPARVCSAGGKWYVRVIVDDYSCYAWVFYLADKGETFGFV